MKIKVLIISFMVLLGACRFPTAELTNDEKIVLDTLYARAIPDLRKELDSLCTAHQDSLRNKAVDSLVDLQLREIKKLISRE